MGKLASSSIVMDFISLGLLEVEWDDVQDGATDEEDLEDNGAVIGDNERLMEVSGEVDSSCWTGAPWLKENDKKLSSP